jgi:cytochrome c peroxidase
MKKILFAFTILLCLACSKKREPLLLIGEDQKERAALLQLQISELERMAQQKQTTRMLQEQFRKARLTYKSLESLVEFYFPGVAKALNGPAIDKVDEYDDKINEATGFQVIEEYLFPEVDYANREKLVTALKILSGTVVRLEQLIESNMLSDGNIFEAQRLHMLRVMSLGISGFDSPVALHALPEAAESLRSTEKILSFYRDKIDGKGAVDSLDLLFKRTYAYLELNNNFDKFDRAEFITSYMNPLCRAIYSYQLRLGIPNNKWLAAINLQRATFFENGAFDPKFFTPVYNRDVDNRVVALGKLLFFDPVLSGNNKRSCASCHQPQRAFADARERSVAFNLKGEVSRNTPSLVNTIFQKSQFWDQRVHFIEDQIAMVVSSKDEMHGSMNDAARKISRSGEYAGLFKDIFGETVSAQNIQTALAAYVRSLRSFNSRFDQYLRGQLALTEQERHGFNVFMGKGKCGTCHFFPLFNGSVPPLYNETESEVLGVPARPDTVNATIDGDLGKYYVLQRALHKSAFKTPTVRNASLTHPYMHNGVFKTLDQVIDFYNRGGGAGIGIDLPNQTLPTDELELTGSEITDLVRFIDSLTDTATLTSTPVALPSFGIKEMDSRTIGGIY